MSLPFYDPVIFTAIDTMHNLLLGTAKHAFDVWVQSGFTANQWVTVYSAVLLKDVLPHEIYCCWLLFVRSCCILLSYYVREADVTTADLLLLQFCKAFNRLHGDDCCTYNMHLHLHVKQTILDFGPAHASWCFAFERFKGILCSFHTNKRSIEPQIMRKFCLTQAVYDLDLPNDGCSPFFQIFSNMTLWKNLHH